MKHFRRDLTEKLKLLEIDRSFATRYVNDGFSGGEKKRLEILQMVMLRPKIAVLDETDSGLDIDALKIVANGITRSIPEDGAVVLVTHYQRLLDYRAMTGSDPKLFRELEQSYERYSIREQGS
jgi:Fe-S cluster assembly ATP-binding protein